MASLFLPGNLTVSSSPDIGVAVTPRPYAVTFSITITEAGGVLSLQGTGQPKFALRPVGARGPMRAPSRDEDMVDVPLVGRVAAGSPLLAVENIEDTVKVDRFFIGQTREVFALRVKGDSMIEDGIFDGDFIFVRKQLHANRGDIVVAMIEDEATVKRYYPEGDNIRFQPANSSMQPIMVRKRDFKSVNLIGIVVGVYRKMRV